MENSRDIFKPLRVRKNKKAVRDYRKNKMFSRGRPFGNFLKLRRVVVNMPISKVGRLLGYSSGQYVSNWEREISIPPEKIVKKLLSIYKINYEEYYRELAKHKIRKINKGCKRWK